MKKLLLILCSLIIFNVYGFYGDTGKRFQWNGIEVVWIEDNRFPSYEMLFHFDEGANGDNFSRAGETKFMFSMLTKGTTRYGYKEIFDALEFYGVRLSNTVTYEYTSLGVSGLAKDIIPTTKMLCHLFSNASFPKDQIRREFRAKRNQLYNFYSNKKNMADSLFRAISLSGSRMRPSIDGNRTSLRKIKQKDLVKRLKTFNKKVTKKIYLLGPKSILNIETVIKNECLWASSKDEIRTESVVLKDKENQIYLLPRKVDHVQIRVGKAFSNFNKDDYELMMLSSALLGAGVTSLLMNELRTKNTLTYGVDAFVSLQKSYGRTGIVTSTNVSNAAQVLSAIKDVISSVKDNCASHRAQVNIAKGFLKGNFLLSIEKGMSYLDTLLYYDHLNFLPKRVAEFSQKIENYSCPSVIQKIDNLFSWNKQQILVIGPKKLVKSLKKIGKVKVIKVKDYL